MILIIWSRTFHLIPQDFTAFDVFKFDGFTIHSVNGTFENTFIYFSVLQPNCLILAITSANQDIATSDAIKVSRQVDPAGMLAAFCLPLCFNYTNCMHWLLFLLCYYDFLLTPRSKCLSFRGKNVRCVDKAWFDGQRNKCSRCKILAFLVHSVQTREIIIFGLLWNLVLILHESYRYWYRIIFTYQP